MALNFFFTNTSVIFPVFIIPMLHTHLVQAHEGMLKTNATSFDACTFT